nr:hypothetical protein [Brevibacillus fulvus]
MSILSSVPKEKLRSDSGLKEVFRDLGRKSGKHFSEQELNEFVARFRSMSRTESVGSLMNKLAKKGVKADDINQLRRRSR